MGILLDTTGKNGKQPAIGCRPYMRARKSLRKWKEKDWEGRDVGRNHLGAVESSPGEGCRPGSTRATSFTDDYEARGGEEKLVQIRRSQGRSIHKGGWI